MAGPPQPISNLFESFKQMFQGTSPRQEEAFGNLGTKFLDAGVLVTSVLPEVHINKAYEIAAEPPITPAGYIDSLQALAGFQFRTSEPPSAQLANSAGATRKKGGPQAQTIVSPTNGTLGLGAVIAKQHSLKEAVAKAFSRLELFEPLIQANAKRFFDGKPITPGVNGDQLFSRICIKVRRSRT